ncbi:MAG TPA: hypothetical protein DCZ75_07375 [Geobacter sp.]|nr:hypothetical protein [Geobacter sp.]
MLDLCHTRQTTACPFFFEKKSRYFYFCKMGFRTDGLNVLFLRLGQGMDRQAGADCFPEKTNKALRGKVVGMKS